MAVRTTEAEVKAIMSSCTASSATITAMIAAASAMIDRVFEYDTSLGATELEELERWLTAHLIASIFERTSVFEKIGDAQIQYANVLGKGLMSTPYGQAVMLMDTTGLLANAGKQNASLYAIPSFDK